MITANRNAHGVVFFGKLIHNTAVESTILP